MCCDVKINQTVKNTANKESSTSAFDPRGLVKIRRIPVKIMRDSVEL